MSGFSKAGLVRMHDGLAAQVGPKLPGLMSLVARGGEVQTEALGALGLDDARPMQHGTLFRVASVTKPIGAVAAMVLVDEGKLRRLLVARLPGARMTALLRRLAAASPARAPLR